jgi:hypothetical protein
MGRNYMKGEGAIIFIIAFVIFLTATLAYTELPQAMRSAMLWA